MTIEKHKLSKSTYLKSLQCLKALYLYKHHYKLRDPVSPALLQRFEKGHDIGTMAQSLFPGGIDCKPKHPWDYRKSVEQTKELIQKKYEVIYEAAFQHRGVLAVADIVLNKNGRWIVYEVKSSISVSETYLEDAALQFEVISSSGLEVDEFFILHLNRKLDDAFNASPKEIFAEKPVLEYCRQRQPFVKEKINEAIKTIEQKQIPDIATGDHCLKPYTCDFFGFCHRAQDPSKLF